MKKVAFAGLRLFMKFPDLGYFRERARETGLAVTEAKAGDDEEFAAQVADAHAIVIIDRKMTRRIIERLEACELIQTLSVGYDCVDIRAATDRRIAVCNTPAYCTDEVANHALTLLMAAARKLHVIIPRTRAGEWDYNFTRPIHNFHDRLLGIIGLGRIGRALVPKAKALGMRVAAYDPYVSDDVFGLLGVDRREELDELLARSDYLSIHALLTPETYHLIGRRELGLMKETAIIINTARGRIWDEQAVLEALRQGRIAAAAADVLVFEPPSPDHPLLREERALITPHVAWYSEESLRTDMEQGMDEVIRVLSGRRPRFIVNPEIYYKDTGARPLES